MTNAVIRDYAGDGDITASAFTQAQLEYLRSQITQDIDDYAPDLRIEVVSEIARWTSGACSGLPGGLHGGPPGATTDGQTGGQTGGQPGSQLFTFRATDLVAEARQEPPQREDQAPLSRHGGARVRGPADRQAGR